MKTTYDIVLGEETVGTAALTQMGLYYEVECSCKLSGEVPFRIKMHTCDSHIDLGLCYKRGESFGLKARVAAKRAGKAPFCFRLLPHKEYTDKCFVPIRPQEPFRYLKRLEDAYLVYRGSTPGICFKDPAQDPQDNDRSQKSPDKCVRP